jgi:uncharacterized protein (DUF1015 family)
MADVQPLRALHYDLAKVGPLADLISPPYDVIDGPARAALAARSPYNVVEIDLPEGGDERYARAGALFARWQADGVLVRDGEPALWALEQHYGDRVRRGFFARVRVEEYGAGRIRPHERTHPGPRADRLALTRATGANLSPIFALHSDPQGAAMAALEPALAVPPWGDATDSDGVRHRLWRCADPAAIEAVERALAGVELLIADGHHRYETARVYAEEIGGEGDHRYVLMLLVAIEDPGLAVLPTHRMVSGLDAARSAALNSVIERDFEARPTRALAPPAGRGPLAMGFVDRERSLALTLRDQAIAERALAGMPEPYRRLDTGVLEALILKGALGLSDDDISHLRGLGYARDVEEAVAAVRSGAYDAAFIMRATPVELVREIAAAGVNMPPKSTYFSPKIPTGLVFNALA